LALVFLTEFRIDPLLEGGNQFLKSPVWVSKGSKG
jgi:hypothetical protein